MTDRTFTAAQAVFQVPELLEWILLLVDDIETLFRSQIVNKAFRDTLHHSMRLKRQLWMEPVTSSQKRPDANQVLQLNPFFSRAGRMKRVFGGGIRRKRDPLTGERTAYAICGKNEILRLVQEEESGAESWRRMYLARPMGSNLRLDLLCYNGQGWARLAFECGKGATAGMVLDTAAEKIKDVDFDRFDRVILNFKV